MHLLRTVASWYALVSSFSRMLTIELLSVQAALQALRIPTHVGRLQYGGFF